MPDEIFIAPFHEGERKDTDSWLIPNDGFSAMENMYLYRGVLTKRPALHLFGRMGLTATETGFANPGGNQYTLGSLAQIPFIMTGVTVYDDGGPQILISDSTGAFTGAGTGTITAGGAIDVTFAAPIIGTVTVSYAYYSDHADNTIRCIVNFEQDVIKDRLIIANRKCFAYYNTAGKEFVNIYDDSSVLPIVGAFDYLAGGTNLFDSTSYKNDLYLTDGADSTSIGMWTYNTTDNAVSQFTPQHGSDGANDLIMKAKFLRPYHRRMVAIYTDEKTATTTSTVYQRRVRWSKIDDADRFRSDIPGEGGGLDIGTPDIIISAGMVRDVLIIACERSIWALEYTGGNPPFRFKRLAGGIEINSVYATLEREDALIFIGHGGIYACDSVNVVRINEKLPDIATNDFNIQYMDNATSVYDVNIDNCMISYTSNENGSTTNDKTLIFSMRDGWFSHYDYGMEVMGAYIHDTATIFDDLTDGTTLWATYEGFTFNELVEQAREDLTLGGSLAGRVYVLSDKSFGLDELPDGNTAYNLNMTSKDFAPYVEKGLKARLLYLDIFVNQSVAEVTVSLYENEKTSAYKTKNITFNNPSTTTNKSDKIWKRIRVNHTANSHKFKITISDQQMLDTETNLIRPRVNAFKLGFSPSGNLRYK